MVSIESGRERLRQAHWLKLPEVQAVFALLEGAGGKTRVVGGAVRDTILDIARPETEIDFATEFTPDEVIARAKKENVAHYPTGIEHGTITLRFGDMAFEVTTLREDVETDGRHAVVAFGTDWVRDAQRRDFTLNALYCGPGGELFDPLDGFGDCESRVVRFIGDPDQRIAEDRLRVYRFFRFSASHGHGVLNEEGLAACGRARDDLGMLSAERVGRELERMLALPEVAGVLAEMSGIGILDFGTRAIGRLLRYEHLQKSPCIEGRLALIAPEVSLEELQMRWRWSNALIKAARDMRDAARLLVTGSDHEAAYRYPDLVVHAASIAAVLADWDHEKIEAVSARVARISAPQFPLRGSDLLAAGMAPGPDLGRKLAVLEHRWIESGFKLDRTALLELANSDG